MYIPLIPTSADSRSRLGGKSTHANIVSHACRDNWYETKESSVRSGLFQALGLLDQHVLAAEPFSPAHAALWISALAAPLLHYSMQYPVSPAGPSNILILHPFWSVHA